jgi:endonuclease-3 related protein
MPERARPTFPARAVYRALFARLGPQGWWPATSDTAMMAGAILVQNTAWTGAARAVDQLAEAGWLDWNRLARLPLPRLAARLRPAGHFNVKARRLRQLARLLAERFAGRNEALFALPTAEMRAVLLEVNGIGPETADSIVLYAARRPLFVVDAYTRRILERHAWLNGGESYDHVARRFTERLPSDPALFNEYHALLVATAKQWCRARAPRCAECPLRRWLPR